MCVVFSPSSWPMRSWPRGRCWPRSDPSHNGSGRASCRSQASRSSSPRTFTIRPGLQKAELSGLADDHLVVLIDGQPAITASEWSRWTTVDVEGLTAGEHRIVCRASNLNGYAGCAVRLRLKYEDGSVEVVTTDPTWNAATGPAVSHGLVGSSRGATRSARRGTTTSGRTPWEASRPNRPLRSACCPASRWSWSARPSRGEFVDQPRRSIRRGGSCWAVRGGTNATDCCG